MNYLAGPKAGRIASRIAAVGLLGAILGATWLPSGAASDVVRCTYNAKKRTVDVRVHAGDARIVRSGRAILGGRAILVNRKRCPSPTTGGSATVSNTKRINILGFGGPQSATIDLIRGPFSTHGLRRDIQISVDLGPGTDEVNVAGSEKADSFLFGTAGINLDSSSDSGVDVTLANIEELSFFTRRGDDFVAGTGSSGTGMPLVLPGPNRIVGGPGRDRLSSGGLNDVLRGGPGADVLHFIVLSPSVHGAPHDLAIGGAGNDILIFFMRKVAAGKTAGLHLTCGEGGDGGSGDDTIEGCSYGDTLKGNGGDDDLFGEGGRDTLKGGDGSDFIDGGPPGPPNGDTCIGGNGVDKPFQRCP